MLVPFLRNPGMCTYSPGFTCLRSVEALQCMKIGHGGLGISRRARASTGNCRLRIPIELTDGDDCVVGLAERARSLLFRSRILRMINVGRSRHQDCPDPARRGYSSSRDDLLDRVQIASPRSRYFSPEHLHESKRCRCSHPPVTEQRLFNSHPRTSV